MFDDLKIPLVFTSIFTTKTFQFVSIMFAGLRCVVWLVVFLNVDFRIAVCVTRCKHSCAKFSVGATSASCLINIFIISYYHFRFMMWMQNLGAGNLPKEIFGKL